MDTREILNQTASTHLDSYTLIEMDRLDDNILDCSWMVDDTEKRIRVNTSHTPPRVTACTDYKDERSGFGILIRNEVLDTDTTEDTYQTALQKLFTKVTH